MASSETWFPSTSRGCGWNVTTVGSGPASIAVRTTDAVAQVDAVEGADGDGARPTLEFLRYAGDLHGATASSSSTRARICSGTRATASAGSRASASEAGSRASASASSTPNGTTAVRRSVRQ